MINKQLIPTAQISWHNDTPLSMRHRDYYFSLKNGLEESRYVFLDANGLPGRFALGEATEPFVVVETGFGTGLNFLATWESWLNLNTSKRPLHFVSIEKYPLSKEDIQKCLDCWTELDHLSKKLIAAYPELTPGPHRIHFESNQVTLNLIFGDVNTDLVLSEFEADCWFLDGFSPSKNPSMWTEQLFSLMAARSKPDCTLATFTAASRVKKGLERAGFAVGKRPGFGSKREMLTGKPSLPARYEAIEIINSITN